MKMEVEEIDLSTLKIKDNDKKRPHGDSVVLDKNTDNHDEGNQLRRSARKKIRPMPVIEPVRMRTRPRRLTTNNTEKEIENYYLNKNVKMISPALETIFEEPKQDIIMSTRKFKRCIVFHDISSEKPDKNKVKKRSMKAKKIIKGGLKKFGKKLGLDELTRKLNDFDNI